MAYIEPDPTLVKKARQAITAAVETGNISTEKHAEQIARRFLPKAEGFEITGVIHPVLPKTVKQVLARKKFRHPWFIRKVSNVLYEDIWGRIWNKTTGIVRKSTKLYTLSKNNIWIDELGGMVWTSTDGQHFTCEWRTSLEEYQRGGASPETFVAA